MLFIILTGIFMLYLFGLVSFIAINKDNKNLKVFFPSFLLRCLKKI